MPQKLELSDIKLESATQPLSLLFSSYFFILLLFLFFFSDFFQQTQYNIWGGEKKLNKSTTEE
jgi:hypothetical protein